MPTIAVLGTFDTKGVEHAFVAEHIRHCGNQALLIDVGTAAAPTITPDVTRSEVLRHAGLSVELPADRGAAMQIMSEAAPPFVAQLQRDGRIDGIISLGGSGGTALGTAVMRTLPLGFPKVMVSTVASGNVAAYVGDKDIVMMPSIVDIAGLNSVSRGVYCRAAAAVSAMVDADQKMRQLRHATSGQKSSDGSAATSPLIVASMFGNTTRCVETARGILESAGYELLVFHATGSGGRTMESLIESGMVSGVLDITTTEWADELVGGILGAGPKRLEAAALRGVPAVVCPGCLDMVNFGTMESVPERFKAANRRFYKHNPQVTLMRTTAEESAELGRILANKINLSTGPVSVLIPIRAISVISAAGQPFYDPYADEALFRNLRQGLRADIDCQLLDAEINDAAFAEACVAALLKNMRVRS